MNGAKIVSMQQDKLKFIDFMFFLQMSLSGFAKAFGLQEPKKVFSLFF